MRTTSTNRPRQPLDALGDPTRRAVLELLRCGPRPVGEIARNLPISRPAVSQHLQVLREAGLVRVEPRGARRLYALDPQGLGELRQYVETFWDDALSAFARAAAHPDAGRSAAPGGDAREEEEPR